MNIITALFNNAHEAKIDERDAPFQYDYGQILRFVGLDLPSTFEVHFSNDIFGESKTGIGTDGDVVIPDEYLTTGDYIYAWIYLHTGTDDGETEYVVTIPVNPRARPTDQEPTPVQQDAITQAIAALNAGVNRADDAADAAEDSAEAAAASAASVAAAASEASASASEAAASATAAAGSASAAAASVGAISAFAEAASASASAAAASETAASESAATASTKASDASDSAAAASASATNAAQSASSAAQSASAASGSASNASNSATAAAGSATSAGNSATAASGSATAAAGSATQAASSATAAGNSATSAAGSATSAAASATTAQNVLDSIPADYSELSDEVDVLKSAFNEAFHESVNLFNKSEVVLNKALDIGSGKTVESMIDSQILNVSPIIPLEVGQYVCNSLFSGTSARLNAYSEDGAYLGGAYGEAQGDGSYVFNIVGDSVKQGRFTYNPTTLNVDTFVFAKGSTLPSEYVPYGTKLNPEYVADQIQSALDNYTIPDNTLSRKQTTYWEHDNRTNLIDKSKLELGYINGNTDGSVHSSTTFYCTDYIPLEVGKQYYFNTYYLFTGYCAFYNVNKEYISGYGNSQTDKLSTPFTPPEGTAYGRFTIVSESNISNAWLCETNQMATKPSDYTVTIVDSPINPKPTDYKGNEISVFNKILCIGDSLTDGAFNESGGSRLIIRSRAYPAKLQALSGVECTNMGYAGYTSAQWYAEYASADLSGHDACIIQLGVNDQLQNVSESDMDVALTSIITKVKNDNGGIKIFVATIIPANSYMTAGMRTRSQMIRDFVSGLNDVDVTLLDMWAYGHTDDLLAYDAGHLSALGYLKLAEDYKAYISYIIRNAPYNYRFVQFIGTNYSYSADSQARQITY